MFALQAIPWEAECQSHLGFSYVADTQAWDASSIPLQVRFPLVHFS